MYLFFIVFAKKKKGPGSESQILNYSIADPIYNVKYKFKYLYEYNRFVVYLWFSDPQHSVQRSTGWQFRQLAFSASPGPTGETWVRWMNWFLKNDYWPFPITDQSIK